MGDCKDSNIPKRLHCNSRRSVQEFYDQERLYRRSRKEEVESPFNISLVDLSVNRQGKAEDILSEEEDVLLNIDIDDENIYYVGMEVVKLQVLNINYQYKTYLFAEGPVKMQLLHEPLDCNYSHSIFRVWYNNEVTTFKNWSQNLGHKSARYYRTLLRNELGKMIIRKVELNV